MLKHALVIVTASLIPLTASAEPVVDELGVRIGGYGFREATDGTAMDDGSRTGWQACRMNGLGVFASRDINKHFFAEGAFDTYFTDSFPTGTSTGNYNTPIDRVSGLLTLAGGARMFPDKIISPYVQVGIGAELTRVKLPALGLEDTAVLPFGFFGVGGVLKVGEKVRLGAALRVNIMGYYDDAQFQTEMEHEYELAAQGQFFFNYAL